jgi:hypothetical protein
MKQIDTYGPNYAQTNHVLFDRVINSSVYIDQTCDRSFFEKNDTEDQEMSNVNSSANDKALN